jgi:hypothetical protein
VEIAPSSTEAWKTVTVANPSANTEWSIAVPSGKYWLVKSVTAQLVQGATQTPQPVLVIDDGTNIFAEGVGAASAQAISTTCTYTWAGGMVQSGIQGTGAAQHAQAPLPCNESLLLKQFYRIRSVTLGMGANSQWQNIVLYVMEDG